MGANQLTYMGLAGMGDLIVTCTSRHSRNRGFGESVAKGGTLAEYTERTHMVVEGAVACVTVDELATERGLELPLTREVREVLYDNKSLANAQEALLGREAKDELHGLGLVD
jgi:glycerol-3-phosphate dehydrogenase (NAD(P)+)